MPTNSVTWSVDVVIPVDARDALDVVLYALDSLGAQEQERDGMVTMQVYFATREAAQQAREQIGAIGDTVQCNLQEVPDQDWNAAWRESMEPAYLGGETWVSPEWLAPPLTSGQRWIRIEPKMAFGTGHHETTRLASQALFNHASTLAQARFLDVGSGSGVLCFVAGLCGAALSVGVEIDGDCRENLAENREANPDMGHPAFVIGTLDALGGESSFDVCAMNMISTHSQPLLGRIAQLLRPEGVLIWGGILTDEHEEIVAAAGREGFRLQDAREENEWWCGSFVVNK